MTNTSMVPNKEASKAKGKGMNLPTCVLCDNGSSVAVVGSNALNCKDKYLHGPEKGDTEGLRKLVILLPVYCETAEAPWPWVAATLPAVWPTSWSRERPSSRRMRRRHPAAAQY